MGKVVPVTGRPWIPVMVKVADMMREDDMRQSQGFFPRKPSWRDRFSF